MTDTDVADIIYIEQLNVETVSQIIRKERPDGLLPTMGGQTGLNLAEQLHKSGVLKECNVEVLGTSVRAIGDGEDREKFKQLMTSINEPVPISKTVNTLEEAKEFVKTIKYPVVIRPAYTLGGTGGGIACNGKEF